MKDYMIGAFGVVMLSAATIGVVGCGDTARSPVAPGGATAASTGAVLDSHGGSGNNSGPGSNSGPGNSNGSGNQNNDPNKQIELNAVIQTMSGTCPALRLTLAGRTVSTTASTEFKHGTCAAVAVGQSAEVKGTMQSDGSITAARIEIKGNEDAVEDQDEVNGAITASTGACPALTLTVGTATVKTTAATVFHDATCQALPVGTVIEAKGTKQADGSLLATRVEREGVEE
jgi:uncharacterized protein DUF5666